MRRNYQLAKKIRFFVSALCLSTLALNVFAQENNDTTNVQAPWSLEDCIKYAFENNITIKQAYLNVESSKKDLLQSKLDLLPSLNGSVSHTFGWGQVPNNQTNRYMISSSNRDMFSISSNLDLFKSFQNINTIKQNKAKLKSAEYNAQTMENSIALQLASAYLQILYDKALVDNSMNQVEISKAQVERTQKLVEAGTKARGDLLNVQSQLASEESKLTMNQNQLTLSRLTLQQILDLDPSDNFNIVEPDVDYTISNELLTSPYDIYKTAVATMPEIQKAKYDLEDSKRGVSIIKGGLYPTLKASGGWGTNYATYENEDSKPFHLQFNNNQQEYITFTLSIPVFNGYMARTRVQQAKLQYISSRYDLQTAELKLRKDIEQAYTDAIAAYKNYDASKKAVEYAAENFKYNEQKFDVGLVSAYDYNYSKTQYANAESDLISAKYTFVFKLKVLDFYLGKPLTLTQEEGETNENE
ncbi:MAG: TolC family protein [Hyphomicrobiales bacterium]